MGNLRLGVNIDHVATLRQARYATMPDSKNAEPDIIAAASICEGPARRESWRIYEAIGVTCRIAIWSGCGRTSSQN